jgi:hypothetical protein
MNRLAVTFTLLLLLVSCSQPQNEFGSVSGGQFGSKPIAERSEPAQTPKISKGFIEEPAATDKTAQDIETAFWANRGGRPCACGSGAGGGGSRSGGGGGGTSPGRTAPTPAKPAEPKKSEPAKPTEPKKPEPAKPKEDKPKEPQRVNSRKVSDKECESVASRLGFDNVHELKYAYLGRKAVIARFDVYIDKTTARYFIGDKAGKPVVELGISAP